MRDLILERIVELGMGDLEMIEAAALIDRDGEVIALAGDMLEQEAMPLVALVLYRLTSPDLSERLFAGELLSISDERELVVAMAKRQLFLVAIARESSERARQQVRELRDRATAALAHALPREEPIVLWSPGDDGSGQGPANLPLLEYRFDAVRPRAKA